MDKSLILISLCPFCNTYVLTSVYVLSPSSYSHPENIMSTGNISLI